MQHLIDVVLCFLTPGQERRHRPPARLERVYIHIVIAHKTFIVYHVSINHYIFGWLFVALIFYYITLNLVSSISGEDNSEIQLLGLVCTVHRTYCAITGIDCEMTYTYYRIILSICAIIYFIE